MKIIQTSSIPQIAVIGSGYWGKNLVRNFDSLGALRHICDKDTATLDRFNEQYPNIQTSSSLSGMLADNKIDGVVVATPAETHYPIAKEALLAGRHVYVEKPLALDRDHAKELIQIAKDKNLVLMVGHLLQYHPAFITLKDLSQSGELGRINYIYSNRLNLGKIRREENILWSFAPHDISMILTLAGDIPTNVMATGGYYLHSSIADVTTTFMEFDSGMRAHIFVSWLHPFKEQKLVVVGDKKMAVFDDTLPWDQKLTLYPHSIDWKDNIPTPNKAEAQYVPLEEAEPLRMECSRFLECIANAEEPYTNGTEGLRVLKVLQASQESLNKGGVKIDLTQEGDGTSGAFIHDTAVIDPGVKIGAGTKIWHFSHILPRVDIGNDVSVGQNVVIGPDVQVGDGCKIQNNVSVYKGVTLEEDVFCGPSMVFTNVINPRCAIPRMGELRETLVRKGASLGANCTIVCGHTIGKHAFVGAGAVVTSDVPAHALVLGNPARRVGWICECGEKLDEELNCLDCGTEYKKKDDGLCLTANP